MAKIIELIITGEKRGRGDKAWRIYQLWTKDGLLVAQQDPCGETFCDIPTSMQGFNI